MGKYDANARIVGLDEINPELRVFRIAFTNGSIEPFKPGQYAEIAIPPTPEEEAAGTKVIRRPYSIASAPGETGHIELLIVRVEDGALTCPLWKLELGAPLWMNPRVKGTFTLDEAEEGVEGKTLVMVSTGTGIAPFMSMLRAHLPTPPWRRFVMINGVRLCADLAYWDELEDLAKEAPWFTYIPCVSREIWGGGVSGRVNKVFETDVYQQYTGEKLTPENTHVFLCGNPQMIDEVAAFLEARGFKPHKKKDPGNIHFERYW